MLRTRQLFAMLAFAFGLLLAANAPTVAQTPGGPKGKGGMQGYWVPEGTAKIRAVMTKATSPPELENAPLIHTGISAGALAATQRAMCNPERTLAVTFVKPAK